MLTTNSISIRFSSELQFEKFSFKSQNISYSEVMNYLNQRKKIQLEKERTTRPDKIDKVDKILLINLDKNGEEITENSGMIEANTKILVKRLPMRELEALEVDYNQM